MYKPFVNSNLSNDVGYERRPRGKKLPAKNESTSDNNNNSHSIENNHPEKPCKACVDFKDWLQHSVTNINTKGKPIVDQQVSINSECPLMRDDLGRASWSLLHTMAAYYPNEPKKEEQQNMNQFINSFSKLFPCPECRSDFQEEIIKSPPDVSNCLSLSTWMCKQHNIVNKKLGKSEFDCKRVLERWKHGPVDGSCD